MFASLGQMGLRKDSGGTKAERSHGKNQWMQTTECHLCWNSGAEGEDTAALSLWMTWFSSAGEML